MIKFSFTRKLRLLTADNFTFVFQQPKYMSTSQITILGRENSLEYPRIGFAIAKKNIKRAHERNRIKRLVRETFRLYQHELPHMDFIVIAKKGIIDIGNDALLKILRRLWYRYCHFACRS